MGKSDVSTATLSPGADAAPPLSPIAYFSSQYARASDTFIRAEVAELRAMGHVVHTFSVRTPPQSEILNDAIKRERDATEDILSAGAVKLIGASIAEAITRPLKFARALGLALRIGQRGLKGRLWPMAYLIEACRLSRRLRAKGVKHLHNHLGRNSAAVAMLASTLTDIPWSMTVHGPTEFDMPHDLALAEKIARAAFTVAISDFGRSQLMRWSRAADWPRIHVVRCGLGADFLSIEPSPVPEVARLVCVGRLVEQKGHLVLIEAARKLAADGAAFQIDIIGDGPLRGRIEETIKRYGLGERIRMLGWKSSAEVRQAIIESRGLVMPSFAEGLPVAIMESLALGRPVISSCIAGVPELVEPNVNGWLVPAGSVDRLARAIQELLQSPVARLRQMGTAGRSRVLEKHDAVREAEKLAQLINRSSWSGEQT